MEVVVQLLGLHFPTCKFIFLVYFEDEVWQIFEMVWWKLSRNWKGSGSEVMMKSSWVERILQDELPPAPFSSPSRPSLSILSSLNFFLLKTVYVFCVRACVCLWDIKWEVWGRWECWVQLKGCKWLIGCEFPHLPFSSTFTLKPFNYPNKYSSHTSIPSGQLNRIIIKSNNQ